MAETGQGDAANNEEESSVEMSNNNAIERGANLSEVVQTDGTHKEKFGVAMSNNIPIKRARGRPKGSTKRKSESLPSGENGGSPVMCPRRSSKKNPRLETVGSSEEREDAGKRPRGRPKKIKQETGGSPPAKKRLGRPKGSLNKKRPAYKAKPQQVVRTDGNSIGEEKKMAEMGQGDTESHEEESSNSPVKSGIGRPQGFKMLKVSLTDIIKTDQVSGLSTGDSKLLRRESARPKHLKDEQSSDEDGPTADHSPKKRGRPKQSLKKGASNNAVAKDLPNGASDAPKAKRGRPKGSTKSQSLTSGVNGASSVSRQYPKSNKKPKLETTGSCEEGEEAEKPPRGRGRPKKIQQETGGSPPAKKRLGRPKGSLNKKRGQRGRPRKYPPSEELKKPRVWKPLGRPRKYPRADPAEGSEPAPRRSRGRPHKSQSKKGAHLRKSLPESLPSPSDPNVEPQRKRGRPPSAPKSDAVPTRKRGRPKGSVNANEAGRGARMESADGNHSTAERDSPLVALKCEAEEVEIKDETSINQDADSEVTNQA